MNSAPQSSNPEQPLESQHSNQHLAEMSGKVDEIWNFSLAQVQSIKLLRTVGYGLLIFLLFDVINLLIPPNFMNPTWEFQTFGGIVERVAVPLIGFSFIFFAEKKVRSGWEIPLLKILSWLVLGLALLFFLFIPLGVFNTIRIQRQADEQITSRVAQGVSQVEQVQQQLTQVNSVQELEELVGQITNQPTRPTLDNPEQYDEVKARLADTMSQVEQNIKQQAESLQAAQRLSLLKNSVKWNLGSLLAAVLFLMMWQGTRWARK
ncbi:HpsJ family protein [Spirulina subsalsa FACHB-351]|uniref:HpsJ family protein n=1 Tax=Spirulina subsalsa FACHB-351 TaxID=234711 RepID=A0ABT3L4B3_9CYAN|nr:HpsJ family protein [Spirulina subsalsa]MCW6036348.1 HpsJ family protein [Spirulina subsalsa FACHB-351]